jgi:hypothetical protein
MSGLRQVRKVFSSSLWLCDCLLHVSVIRDVSNGNSMGLYSSAVETEVSILRDRSLRFTCLADSSVLRQQSFLLHRESAARILLL